MTILQSRASSNNFDCVQSDELTYLLRESDPTYEIVSPMIQP